MNSPEHSAEQPVKIILPLYGVEANRSIWSFAEEEKSKELLNLLFGLERARELAVNNPSIRSYQTLFAQTEEIAYQEVNTKLGDLPQDPPESQDTWTRE